MAGEMFSEELEEGGAWFEARLELEDVARLLYPQSFKVIPFDQYQGPCCRIEKDGVEAILWLAEDDKFLIELEGSPHHVIFFKDEAPEVWNRLLSF